MSALLITAVVINALFTVSVEANLKLSPTKSKPLKDIGHSILPLLNHYRITNDIIVGLLVVCAFKENDPKFAHALAVCIFIRMITMYSTILPKSIQSCKSNGLLIGGCHDKVFSGQMATAILSSMCIIKYHPEYKNLLIMINIILGVLIIGSRDHYTIDVIVGTTIALLIGKQLIN